MPVYDEQLTLDDNPEYAAFVEKFKPKKTTDDCYTPENIFNAVVEWAAKEYGFDVSQIIRPFWPGADYRTTDYPDGCVVVDNPPFSIVSKIIRFYHEHGIRYFLFAPSLTCLSAREPWNCAIVTDSDITYQNGAKVRTAFITNMDSGTVIRTAPDLHDILAEIDKQNTKNAKAELPKYDYPMNICTAAMCQRYAKYGVKFRVRASDAAFISAMDAQKPKGKTIFGSGLLLSERAAAERAAAERAAAERAAAQKWKLSDRELQIIAMMGGD